MVEKANNSDINSMVKSGSAFRCLFERSKAYAEGEGDDRELFVEMVASSDGTDLAGDVMARSALEDMQSTAVGTLMLRDHNPSVEKIFGTIVASELINENGKSLLKIKANVDQDDPQNIRIWNSISKGAKLGASVTVLILKTGKQAAGQKSGGLNITSVKLLEVSIVTIPCNQDAWTMAASASKALQLRAKSMPEDNDMEQNETQADVSRFLPRTVEAMSKFAAFVAMDAEERSKAEVPQVAKGLFQDKIDHLSFWALVDILNEVRWHLMWQKWIIQEADGDEADFTEIVSEWDTALQEFHAAALDSFTFWEGLQASEETASLSLDDYETIAKEFANIAELTVARDGEVAEKLREIGTQMLEVAEKAGIPLAKDVETAAPAGDSPSTEAAAEEPAEDPVIDIEKSAAFIAMKERAEKAEEALADTAVRLEQKEQDLGTAQEELSIAKAGLEAATTAIQTHLRKPLSVTA